MRRDQYEIELRRNGPMAKAMRKTLAVLMKIRETAEINGSGNVDVAMWRDTAVDASMAMSAVMSALGFHVAWGSDPLDAIRRESERNKSAKVKAEVDKLIASLEKGGL